MHRVKKLLSAILIGFAFFYHGYCKIVEIAYRLGLVFEMPGDGGG